MQRSVANKVISSLSLWLEEQIGGDAANLRRYLSAMAQSFELEPPLFQEASYGDAFRKCAVNPFWTVQSLVSNSVKEGNGARELWEFARRISCPLLSSAVQKHAKDEARHARLYVGLIGVVFPNALSKSDRRDLLSYAPQFPHFEQAEVRYCHDEILDTFVQINLGELRTRLHQLLMQPVLEGICNGDNRIKLRALLGSLGKDELAHLRYTAQIIDEWLSSDRPRALDVMRTRLRQFNGLTRTELGTQALEFA